MTYPEYAKTGLEVPVSAWRKTFIILCKELLITQ